MRVLNKDGEWVDPNESSKPKMAPTEQDSPRAGGWLAILGVFVLTTVFGGALKLIEQRFKDAEERQAAAPQERVRAEATELGRTFAESLKGQRAAVEQAKRDRDAAQAVIDQLLKGSGKVEAKVRPGEDVLAMVATPWIAITGTVPDAGAEASLQRAIEELAVKTQVMWLITRGK